jgi:hypothetical protein
MLQIKEQTHKEKVEMYMKLSKKELVEMLIEANKQISELINNRPLNPITQPYVDMSGGLPDEVPFSETCSCNPKNGGSGICGCVMANKMIPNPKKYGYPDINYTTTTDFELKNENDDK